MTNFTTIEASVRAKAGKGAARATRREGLVPAVIYGAKQDASLIALDPRVVLRELVKTGWRSRLYEIKADGGAPIRALMREVQLHPVSDRPIHVDFQRLAPGEHIKVAVQVVFTGEESSVGIKRGGVLNIVRHTVEVSVDPDNIPTSFTVDLSNLDINDNVRWSDIKHDDNVVPGIVDRDFVIATVAAPTVVAEPEPAAAPAAPAAPAKKGGKK
ncbi:50S ribosomal protein L25/general stress protein Ctc [Acetobacteraceae bacterium KSS8]|uniref:Large ribosomal subunit protein bL25 n=1 Tax=Endosaccharibacter trunci TaxID=2812733 RepID=A0ABT1W9K2_9PROT|nr:50S ribosomal protein L25/general stress protein Ctc [Acetobacteraceae bacterium KSS8]